VNAMSYKGYLARIEYSAEDRLFVGHLAGIRDIIGFHGATVDELEEAFHEAVDDYLAMCETLGQPPNPALVDETLTLHVSPEVHAHVIHSAELAGKSLNQWASDALERAVTLR
jgi:predicted HicB family RNase H-like nuclease